MISARVDGQGSLVIRCLLRRGVLGVGEHRQELGACEPRESVEGVEKALLIDIGKGVFREFRHPGVKRNWVVSERVIC